ncbi:hypothetical protein GW17_00018756 [Ensete ventricosum]|nr:hypothetical protein GW17_00018756 [Ensete ventricosum]
MFNLLRRLPTCGLDTSQSSTQVAPLSICIELMVALTPPIPRVNPPLSLIFTSTLSVPSYDVFIVASQLDLTMYPPIHYFIQDHATTPRCSLGPFSFVEIVLTYSSSTCVVHCTRFSLWRTRTYSSWIFVMLEQLSSLHSFL